MSMRTLGVSAMAIAALVLTANVAWAAGFELGETKEQLKLKYDVSVTDDGAGRVTLFLTIADEGRLKPLGSVDLHFPSKDGTGYVDLLESLATSEKDGKRVARVQVKKELVEGAEIHLKTSHLDGKRLPLTWYYHNIPFAKYMASEQPKKK